MKSLYAFCKRSVCSAPVVSAVMLFLVPAVSFAATGCPPTPGKLRDLVCLFLDLIQTIVPVVFSLMLLVFFWGLARMILHAGDETAREEGKHIMIWGVIGLFVAVSIYGIVGFLYGSFNFSQSLSFPPLLPVWN